MDGTMARRHLKLEEIVAKLRQVDVLTGQGKSIAEAVKSIGQAGGACVSHGDLPLTQPVSPIGIAARLGGLVAIG